MHGKQTARSKQIGSSRRSHRRSGFTWIELALAGIVIAVLIALLLPAASRGREPARRTQCRNNLNQIGLALHNYHDVYNAFPPAYTVDADGKPLHSWRTLILPYLDQALLYNSLDLSKPWDDPANSALLTAAKVSTFACPSSPTPSDHTTYFAVVTAESTFGSPQSRSISEITDGTSNTLLIVEAPFDQAVVWYSPHDADEKLLLSLSANPKRAHTGGQHALLADETVRFLSQVMPPQIFHALTTAAAGDTVGEY